MGSIAVLGFLKSSPRRSPSPLILLGRYLVDDLGQLGISGIHQEDRCYGDNRATGRAK